MYERTLPLGYLSESEMIQLLQRLSCKHLDLDEIVNASLRKNAKHYASNLEHDKETTAQHFSISVGHNPWYVASVIRDDASVSGNRKKQK